MWRQTRNLMQNYVTINPANYLVIASYSVRDFDEQTKQRNLKFRRFFLFSLTTFRGKNVFFRHGLEHFSLISFIDQVLRINILAFFLIDISFAEICPIHWLVHAFIWKWEICLASVLTWYDNLISYFLFLSIERHDPSLSKQLAQSAETLTDTTSCRRIKESKSKFPSQGLTSWVLSKWR